MASVVTNKKRADSSHATAAEHAATAKTPTRQPQESLDRGRLRRLTGVKILSTGGYVPEDVVRNEDLAALGCDPDWIIQRTGIRERRRTPPEQATSDLAIEAGRRCIEQAGVSADDVDLLIVGTNTPDSPIPSSACRVQHALGLRAPAMDLNAGCAGFVYSLVTGMQFVASGCSSLALVIGADTLSRIVNPDDKKTFPLFGDGAGAALVTQGTSDQGLLSYTLGSDGSGVELLWIPAGGSRRPHSPQTLRDNQQYLHMDGRTVFKWAVRMLADTINDVILHAGLSLDDIKGIFLHQANLRIISAAASELGVPIERLALNVDRFGNTSAASIPLVLDEAHRRGDIKPGDPIVLSGFGAGLSWGTAVLRW